MSNSTQSYHLPDLLGIISTIPLRTNPHCKPASQSSEKRVLDLGVLSTREAELVHPTKVGLLVALCFPTCDRPQLTLLSEAGMWLLVSGIRSTEQSDKADSRPDLDDEADKEQLDALELLKKHELLQQLRMFLLHSLLYKWLIFKILCSLLHDRRISRLASLGRGTWEDRFKRTLLLYYNAQRMATVCASDSRIPTLDDFLSVRREMLGTSIMFDLAELLEVFPFPEFLHDTQREKLEQIKQCAFNIIAWSIVSCLLPNALFLWDLVHSGCCILPPHSHALLFQSAHDSYDTQSSLYSGSNESRWWYDQRRLFFFLYCRDRSHRVPATNAIHLLFAVLSLRMEDQDQETRAILFSYKPE